MNSEQKTQQEKIDLQLGRAGWDMGCRRQIEDLSNLTNLLRTPNRSTKKFVGYVLFDHLERPLAIVVAKRSSSHLKDGDRQAAEYADALCKKYGFDPFIFLTDGDVIWYWHRKLHPPRKISGFFNEEDLLRLAYLDKFGKTLLGVMPSERIINRAYQIEAVKTIAEQIEKAKRRFLIVLATGTGKTRVSVALVEMLQRNERIQRVLFLADRRELVKQALGAFKEYLPSSPRSWIEGGNLDKDAQIHFATYPGMMSIYQHLSPGYYDLIIADESHRSIYSRYKSILDYFDAICLGLTATPTDYLDHNTFDLFECHNNRPTFYYGYDEAVRDKYLVPYRPVRVAAASFQIKNLKPGELPEELKQICEKGIEPDQFSFEGSEFEQKVTNTDINDAIIHEFMEHAIKDAIGIMPAKSIIFAVSHRHAIELFMSFNRLYPDLQQKGLTKIIDSHMEQAEKTLDDFKNKNFPRVAISVDMLDTGIDVPSIRNLVIVKPVFSKVKFWQMLGRGTRTWIDPLTGEQKTDFLVIDHWGNFDYFQVNKDSRTGSISEPLPTRLFRLRLEKFQLLVSSDNTTSVSYTIRQLRNMVSKLPLDNINVAPHSKEIQKYTDSDELWRMLGKKDVDHLSSTIAPLFRFSLTGTYAELQFENQTEQLAIAYLRNDTDEITKFREHITENLLLLPTNITEVRPHIEKIVAMQTGTFWCNLTYPQIMQLQKTFAPLMRFCNRRTQGVPVRLALPADIQKRKWIIFGPAGEGAFAETYRVQVETLIKDLSANNPALQRLKRGEELTSSDIDAVSVALNGPDLFVDEKHLREAYQQPTANLVDFLRHIFNVALLPSREEKISHNFDEWVRRHPKLSATQLMFVRTLRKAVVQKAEASNINALKKPPFTSIGDPKQLFNETELAELFELINSFAN